MIRQKRKLNIETRSKLPADSENKYCKKIKIEKDSNQTKETKEQIIARKKLSQAENRTAIKERLNWKVSDYKTTIDVKGQRQNLENKPKTEAQFKFEDESLTDHTAIPTNNSTLTQIIDRNSKFSTRKLEKDDTCWQNYELLSEYHNIDFNVSRNVVQLFDEGCTIPFIARYRKDITGNMGPEILRDVKQNYDKINILKSRIQTVLNCIEKTGNLNNSTRKSILSATTIEEVEHIV